MHGVLSSIVRGVVVLSFVFLFLARCVCVCACSFFFVADFDFFLYMTFCLIAVDLTVGREY